MMDTRAILLQWFINSLLPMVLLKIKIKVHKRIIKKFEKQKLYSSFANNIWGLDLVNIQLISKFNRGIRFLLCVFNIFSKHGWVNKKGITITNDFQKTLDESNRKPNEIWVDKDSDFYNRSKKSYG